MSEQIVILFNAICSVYARMTLIECGHFGDVGMSLQGRLDAAYRGFREFCKIRKIQCSQPPFTVKMDPWLSIVFFFRVLFLYVASLCNCKKKTRKTWTGLEVVKQSGEAKLIAKAYNGRCITEWLAFELLSACHNPQDPRIPPIAVCTFLGCITITASALFVTCFLNFYTFFSGDRFN